MKQRVVALSAIITGIGISLFLLVYQPLMQALFRPVAAAELCSPDAPSTAAKKNPNQVLFVSCGGFL